MRSKVLISALWFVSHGACTRYEGLPDAASSLGDTVGSDSRVRETLATSATSIPESTGDDITTSEQVPSTSVPVDEETHDVSSPDGCFPDDDNDSDFSSKDLGVLNQQRQVEAQAEIQSEGSLCDSIDVFRFEIQERVIRAKLRLVGRGKGKVVISFRLSSGDGIINVVYQPNGSPLNKVLVFPPGKIFASARIISETNELHDWARVTMTLEAEAESEKVVPGRSCSKIDDCSKLLPFPRDANFENPEISGYVGPFASQVYYLFSPGGAKHMHIGVRAMFGEPKVKIGRVMFDENGNRRFEGLLDLHPENGQFVTRQFDFESSTSLYAVQVRDGKSGANYVIHYSQNGPKEIKVDD